MASTVRGIASTRCMCTRSETSCASTSALVMVTPGGGETCAFCSARIPPQRPPNVGVSILSGAHVWPMCAKALAPAGVLVVRGLSAGDAAAVKKESAAAGFLVAGWQTAMPVQSDSTKFDFERLQVLKV